MCEVSVTRGSSLWHMMIVTGLKKIKRLRTTGAEQSITKVGYEVYLNQD